MSAGNAPPNPGSPRHNPNIPKPSNLRKFGPGILVGGTLIGVLYAYQVSRPPTVAGKPLPPNPLKTPGVKNIEGAYQSGGATSTHTKAYGGTTLGKKDDIQREGQSGTAKEKGFEEDHLGHDQRADQPIGIGKAWEEMKYGDKKGK